MTTGENCGVILKQSAGLLGKRLDGSLGIFRCKPSLYEKLGFWKRN
jgi:hypothetical protein